jgi:histidinol phosphatase-like enzyme
VARLEQLTEEFDVPLDRVVYVGDRSSDIHVMLHLNRKRQTKLMFGCGCA